MKFARVLRAFVAAASAVAVGCTTSTLTSSDPSPTKCQLSINGTAMSVGAVGGTATISLTTQPECAWKAATDASWIAEVKPAAGQGSAQVEVKVAPNADPVPRQGTVQISGIEVQIAQEAAPCVFEVSPHTRAMSSAGGTTSVSVATHGGC